MVVLWIEDPKVGVRLPVSGLKEIMQFERVTSRNWYTHLTENQTPYGFVGSSPTELFRLFLFL